MVVVVDPDIDVRNPDQVEWAIIFRSQPAHDIIIVNIVNDVPGGTLDPSIACRRSRRCAGTCEPTTADDPR
jgi:UbiD family decarboxylase